MYIYVYYAYIYIYVCMYECMLKSLVAEGIYLCQQRQRSYVYLCILCIYMYVCIYVCSNPQSLKEHTYVSKDKEILISNHMYIKTETYAEKHRLYIFHVD